MVTAGPSPGIAMLAMQESITRPRRCTVMPGFVRLQLQAKVSIQQSA
jgi:hypothetical protein